MRREVVFHVLLLLLVCLTLPLMYAETRAATSQTITTSRVVTTSSTTSRTVTASTATNRTVTPSSLTSRSLTSSTATNRTVTPSGTTEPVLNDLPVLKAKYPTVFNPNNTYLEFASTDLSTAPRADGTVTFRNVTVTHQYVSGVLIPNGSVQWTFVRGPPNVVVFILADYGSQVTYASLPHNTINTFLVSPRNGAYPHVYLFLMS